MPEIIFTFLQQRVPDTLFNLYLDVDRFIQINDLDESYESLELLFSEGENRDLTNLLDVSYQFFLNTVLELTRQFGVFPNEDITLQDALYILETLHYIENFEDVDTILDIIEFSDHNTTALYKILETVGIHDESYFYPLIDSVNDALIERIKELFSDRKLTMSEEIEEDKEKDVIINKLKAINFTNEIKSSFIYKQIINGVGLNYPLQSYFNIFSKDIFNEDQTVRMTAIDLALLSIISRNESTDLKTMDKLMETYCSDIIRLSTLKREYEKVKNEFTKGGV